MTPTELKPFCHATRLGCTEPFSHGDFTYATDGRILLRVPRLAEVPAKPDAPTEQRILELYRHDWQPQPVPLPTPLPTLKGPRECFVCEGSGKASTTTACDYCDGTGKLDEYAVAVRIGALDWSHLYLHQLAALPALRFYPPIIPDATTIAPARFEFAGGDGILMCMAPHP